ncbi:hypothetical protein JMG10_14640 [Nostoc ellipsosporum NOK]|nr:hypothetical protein [Nostoc ellipsosporum NOK]
MIIIVVVCAVAVWLLGYVMGCRRVSRRKEKEVQALEREIVLSQREILNLLKGT